MNIRKTFFYFLPIVAVFLFMFLVPKAYSIDCTTDPSGTKSELELHIKLCQEEIEEEKKTLQKTQVERTTTEAQIQLINHNLSKKQQEIRKKDILIYGLNKNIDTESDRIRELQKRLQTYISAFEILMRKSNESENYDIIDLLINDLTVTEFFSKTFQHYQIQNEIKTLVNEIELIKKRINFAIDDLDDKKSQQETIRIQKKIEKKEIDTAKKIKKNILTQQLNQEDEITSSIESKEKQIRKIKNSIFELLGISGEITFAKAVEYAVYAEELTGVDAAFLLGLFKQETNIGKNVGTASYKVSMKSSRDTPAFFAITDSLDIGRDDIKVSARQIGGWGGAMGPAQFIPATWAGYGGFVKTNKSICSDIIISKTSRITIGSSGTDVLRLQKFLNSKGFTIASSGPGSPGRETNVFGGKTSQALTKFQKKYKSLLLTSGADYNSLGEAGPKTAALINNIPCEEDIERNGNGWEYDKSKDRIRNVLQSDGISNPWNTLHAFVASALFLKDLGAASNSKNAEYCAALKYFQGPASGCRARRSYNTHYPKAVLSHTSCFRSKIDFIQGKTQSHNPC